MANTLSSLIPDLYAALDVVSRELVGFIPSVNRDSRADRIALNQTLRSPVTPVSAALGDNTPAMSIPGELAQVIGNASVTITNSKFAGFSWNGEEILGLDNNGPGQINILQDQFTQCMRIVVNQMESDIAAAGQLGASRGYGAAATNPFASDIAGSANVRKILDDNGAPLSDRSLVINTTAGAGLRTLEKLTKVNEAGTNMTLRDGELLNLHGFSIKESAQVAGVTAGTAASGTTDGSAYAKGATVITLASAGSGTILAGDIITFSNDTSIKYVVASTTVSNVSGGGTITLAKPGLIKALTATAKTIVVTADYSANLAFSRNAILLATRLPALPPQGDLAIDRMTITDPRSNISFEVALYPGFRMVTYHVSAAWGVGIMKPEHLAVLIG